MKSEISMSSDAVSQKKSLRAEMLAAREKVTPEAAKAAGIEVAKRLVELVPESADVVAGYRAVRGEIDVTEAMAQLSERGHALSLPVVPDTGKPLKFRRWRLGDTLAMGRFGIEIPPESEPELVPDTVLVPLVAFDKRGHRLGYGAGFYDATITHLRRVKSVQVIGVAFAAQQADHIPDEPHDEALDAVVTERGIYPALVAGSGSGKKI
jgi:5-formyltetrahydrofolate cyclo-ligase